MGVEDAQATEPVWVVTGTSSGVGLSLVKSLLSRGMRVVATSRNVNRNPMQSLIRHGEFAVLPMDLRDSSSIRQTVESIVNEFGQIDVVVNNAGYGLLATLEDSSLEDINDLFAINFFGPVSLIKAVLPYMRSQKSGHIINVSSVGGFVGSAGLGAYNATKFALEGLSECLARELSDFGIHVTIVELGAFRTEWSGVSLKSKPVTIADYSSAIANHTRIQSFYRRQPGDPEKAAESILAVSSVSAPPLRLVLGADAVHAIREKLDRVRSELDAWLDLSNFTMYE